MSDPSFPLGTRVRRADSPTNRSGIVTTNPFRKTDVDLVRVSWVDGSEGYYLPDELHTSE